MLQEAWSRDMIGPAPACSTAIPFAFIDTSMVPWQTPNTSKLSRRLAKLNDAPMKTIITAHPTVVSGVMTWVPNLLPSQPPNVIVSTAPIEAPSSANPSPAASSPV